MRPPGDGRTGARAARRRSVAVAIGLLAAVVVTGCDTSNPVVPADPSETMPTYDIVLTATPDELLAGSGDIATIDVSVTGTQTGEPAADGTEVQLSTTLGSFSDGAQARLETTVVLADGTGSAALYPGDTAGTASVLAFLVDSSASLGVAVVDPGDPPVAEFTFESSGLLALFTDASMGDPDAWSWEFGDPSSDQPTSSAQNPQHTFSVDGTFVVTLTASNTGGSSSKSQFVTVAEEVPPPAAPVADFCWNPQDLQVIFCDLSAGEPESWLWDFGDPDSAADDASALQDPGHTFTAGGTFIVTLVVTNAAGSSGKSRFVCVEDPADPTATCAEPPPGCDCPR